MNLNHTPLTTDLHTTETRRALAAILALPCAGHVSSIEEAVIIGLVEACYEPARVLMDALLSAETIHACADVAVALIEDDGTTVH